MPPFFTPDQPEVALLRDLVSMSRRVLLTTHRRPDGDAIGSVLALMHALHTAGKDVTAHAPDPAPEFLEFLPGAPLIVQSPGPIAAHDLVLAVDHSELSRTGIADELLEARIPVVAIDHHATADRRATVPLIAPEAAATCELLAELLPLMGLSTNPETATCLLAGIITDTGAFQHANTSARVLALAGTLLERGADLRGIVTQTFGNRSLPALRVMGRALERLEANPKTGAVITVVTHTDLEECGASSDELSGVVNLLNSIPEASFSLLLTEVERGKLKGSLRSEPEDAVDVSAIARRFGGGGHKLASGFEIAGRLVHDEDGWRIE